MRVRMIATLGIAAWMLSAAALPGVHALEDASRPFANTLHDGWGTPAPSQPRKAASRTSPRQVAGQAPERATPAAPPAPAASAAGQVELAALAQEVKELTALLKEVRAKAESVTAPAPAERATVPAASPSSPASHSVLPAGSTPPARPPVPVPVPAPPAAAAPATQLDLKADIQIQGERRFATGSAQNNLDDFWGRLNFGAEYKGKGFESKANVRIFPEGFGFEPLTGATFDTAGQGNLKVQSQPSSRIVVNHAWVKFTPGALYFKVGRFETMETWSANFGNYVDLGPGGRFLSRPAAHNALEGGLAQGRLTSSILLGTNDRKLNRGFLRVYEKYASPLGFQAGLGYRVNLFDRFKYDDEELLQRIDASFLQAFAGWKVFGEAALLQAKGTADNVPVLVGIQPPTGKALDLLSLEAEWMPDRVVAGKRRELLANFHARKTFGRLRLEAGCFSDIADPDANAFGFGLRMTSTLK